MRHDDIDIEAVIAGQARLTPRQALQLYRHASMHDLSRWATAMCRRIHGSAVRTYILDRNINYTNVCTARCTFCAFRRDLGAADAYTLSTEQLHEKVRQLIDRGGTQILLQGGMHPDLPITFYEQMLRELKAAFPQIHIHGYSPPEFVEFVAVFDLPNFPTPGPGKSSELPDDVWNAKLEAIMQRLQRAGLDSIPGGGGEIFAHPVRRRIGIGKATANQWPSVMAAAHRIGMSTSATMMFGHIEGVGDRIDHMNQYRTWQDKAIANHWPGRYISFIAWPFQPDNTPLGRLPHWPPDSAQPFPGDALSDMILQQKIDPNDTRACAAAVPDAGKHLRLAGASTYLRMQAVARLFMDNIPSIGSSWVTMGPKIGQLGLFYGANDMGSIMIEENVVSAAGTTYCLNEQLLCRLIREAGFTPAQRDNQYNIIKQHDDDDAPDLQVTDWSQHRQGKEGAEGPRGQGSETISLRVPSVADC